MEDDNWLDKQIEEFKKSNIPGEIVVASTTNIGWTPIILTLAFVSWIRSIFTIIYIDGTAMGIINCKLIIGLITITIIGMVLTQVVFFSIGLLFAATFNSHNAALKSGFLFVLITYVISIIIEYVGNVDYLNFLSPFRYFIGTEVVNNGISIIYVLVSTFAITASIYLTYIIYKKKDLLY
jgi:ABC-2 type transport system permease protein